MEAEVDNPEKKNGGWVLYLSKYLKIIMESNKSVFLL